MKKFNIFLISLFIVSSSATQLHAQETSLQTSTEAAPVWYNMNSAATAAGAINAALASYYSASFTDSIIKGDKPTSPAIILPTQNQDKYLWRFENDGTGSIYIINKSSGLKVKNPPTLTTGLNERFRLKTIGSTFTFTPASGISSNGVSGTAFYFTPTDVNYSNAGRYNCDGGIAEMVLYKASTSGDILQTGGKGSLFWLRLVPMKTVSVSVSSLGNQQGTVVIKKDDGTTNETTTTVSKAQSIGVTVLATPNVGSQFVEWRNKTENVQVATTASYTYSSASNIELEAVFSLSTSIHTPKESTTFSPNPFKNFILVNEATEGSVIYIFDLNGKKVLTSKDRKIDTTSLQKGNYIILFTAKDGIKTVKALKE